MNYPGSLTKQSPLSSNFHELLTEHSYLRDFQESAMGIPFVHDSKSYCGIKQMSDQIQDISKCNPSESFCGLQQAVHKEISTDTSKNKDYVQIPEELQPKRFQPQKENARSKPTIQFEDGLIQNVDYKDQMKYAFRLIESCLESKVSQLQIENNSLKTALSEKTNIITNMERNLEASQKQILDLQFKLNSLTEDNKTLVMHINKIKLENLQLDKIKQTILSTLTASSVNVLNSQDIDHLCRNYEGNDIRENTQMGEIIEREHNRSVENMRHRSADPGKNRSGNNGTQRFTPRVLEEQSQMSSRRESTSKIVFSEQKHRKVQSLSKSIFELPSSADKENSKEHRTKSHHHTSSICPLSKSTKKIDGKKFFKLVKERLTIEEFNEFLLNIKCLNNKSISKEDAIEKSRKIFSQKNEDLFKDFLQILNPNNLP